MKSIYLWCSQNSRNIIMCYIGIVTLIHPSFLQMILLADDTTVFYSHENISVPFLTTNTEIEDDSNRFKENKRFKLQRKQI